MYVYRSWRDTDLEPQDAYAKAVAGELPEGFDKSEASRFTTEATEKAIKMDLGVE